MTIYLRRAFERFQRAVSGLQHSKAYLFGYLTVHWCIVMFALVLIVSAVYPPVEAQSELKELTRRIEVFEGMNIPGQLATIHQQLLDAEENGRRREADWKPLGTAIAAGVLVLERAVRAMGAKVRESDG